MLEFFCIVAGNAGCEQRIGGARMGARDLAAAVAARRNELGMSQEEAVVAAGKGISTSNWSKIENGKEGPYRVSTFAAIDRALRWATGSAQAIADGESSTALAKGADDVSDRLTMHEDRIEALERQLREVAVLVREMAERALLPDADELQNRDGSRTAR